MSSQRAWLWTIALVALIAAVGYRIKVFSEPMPAPPPKVVFVTGGSGPYWQLTVAGAKAAAKREKVDLTVETPDVEESLEEQMAILQRLDDQKFDGIALSPLDSESQTLLINGLADKMRVVTFDSDAELSERHSHIGASNFSAGRTCARLVREAIPNGGKVALLLVNTTKENLIDRKGGFQERLEQISGDAGPDGKAANFEIVGIYEDNGKNDKCAENIRKVVAENPDLACIVAMNAQEGPVLLETLKELGKLDKIKLITFDAEDATLNGIEEGHIYATVAQDPYKYGFEAVSTLKRLCEGEGTDLPIVGRGAMYFPVEPLKQENLSKFRDAMRAREEAAAKGQEKKDAGKEAAKPAA